MTGEAAPRPTSMRRRVCVAVGRRDGDGGHAWRRLGAAQRAGTGLTNAPALARAYDAIFDADFPAATARLDGACGHGWRAGAPLRARRRGLAATRATCSTSSRAGGSCRPTRSTARARCRVRGARRSAAVRETEVVDGAGAGDRAEAWFYAGAAYGMRVQWRALRGERLAAARDGKRIKDALERALALDPDLQDAYFGIGLYHYYADVAPVAARMLRWMLLLPGRRPRGGVAGDAAGAQRRPGAADEADYQLHTVYVWYEKDTERALEHGARPARAASAQSPCSPRRWPTPRTCICRTTRPACARGRRSWPTPGPAAWPGPSRRRCARGWAWPASSTGCRRPTSPSSTCAAWWRRRPHAPVGALADAYLQLGDALDRLGAHDDARAAYDAAVARTPAGDPLKTAARARAAQRRTRIAPPRRPTGSRSRAGGRSSAATSARPVRRSTARWRCGPDDQLTRYRKARLLLAQRHERAAIDAARGRHCRDGHAARTSMRPRASMRRRRTSGRDRRRARHRALRAHRGGVRRRSARQEHGTTRARAAREADVIAHASVRARRDSRHHAVEVARSIRNLTSRVRLDVARCVRFLTSRSILCLTQRESHS